LRHNDSLFLALSLIFCSHTSHIFFCSFFFLLLPPPPRSTLFPYTTLFRSIDHAQLHPRAVALGREPVDACGRDVERLLNQHVQRSEEHTSELQSLRHLVCRLLLEKKKKKKKQHN